MAKRHHKELLQFLEANGYRYLRTNNKGYDVYRNDASVRHTLVSVTASISDAAAGHIRENISKELGIPVKQAARKRSGKAVKQQQQVERQREAERVQREKDELATVRTRLVDERHEREDELAKLRAKRAELIDNARIERERRDRQLGGLAAYLTNEEVASIEEHIARKERELVAWQAELVGAKLTTNQYRHHA
jgi:hypothetical protein